MAEEKIRLQQRREKLLQEIREIKEKKEDIINFTKTLSSQLNSNEITQQEYQERLNKNLQGRTPEQWLKYYEDYIFYYKYQIKLAERLIKQENQKSRKKIIVPLSIILGFILISIIAAFLVINPPTEFFKTITPETASEIAKLATIPITLDQGQIIDESLTQYQAIINKPVKWEKEFTTDSITGFNTKLPENSKNIKVIKSDTNEDITSSTNINEEWIGKKINLELKNNQATGQKYKIIFETPAPTIEELKLDESEINKLKKMKISGSENISIKNIIAFTNIPKLTKQQVKKLRLYEIKDNQKKLTKFTSYDTNEDGLYDLIEWIADSNTIYEIEIVIIDAEHLNKKRELITNIYNYVNKTDDITYTIPKNEYVRAYFETNLTNENVIDIFINNTEPTTIQIYEKDSDIVIGELKNITKGAYYFDLIHTGSQSVFDLKSVKGDIIYDYIHDAPKPIQLKDDSLIPNTTTITEGDQLIIKGIYSTTNKKNSGIWEIQLNSSLGAINGNDTCPDFGFEIVDINIINCGEGATCTSNLTTGRITINANNRISFEIDWLLKSCQDSNLNSPFIINNIKVSGNETLFIEDTGLITVNPPNQPPQITFIESISDIDPIENNISTITFKVQVTDSDGWTDITNVGAKFNRTGEITKTASGGCTYQSDDGLNTANYSCSIDMQYYDGAGTWNITVNATDSVINLVENTSTTFEYLSLNAMEISLISLTWPIINQGQTNRTLGTSVIINNTGNYESNITIKALDIYGKEITAEFLPANLFSIGTISTGANEECNAPTQASLLQNGTQITIINSFLNKGPSEQEEIFYCLIQVPFVSSQEYLTGADSWTISLLLAAITIKSKKKKKKQKAKQNKKQKSQIQIPENDKLIQALNLITDELKQTYSLNKKEIIEIIIERLRIKYKVSIHDIKDLINSKHEFIPIEIFSKKLGALEAITKYLKENLNMSYHEISELLNRNERTIWTAYNKSKQKQPESIKITQSTQLKISLPISIFKNRKLTILEALTIHLKNKNLNYKEIGELLHRDQRNIWTIYSRAIKKH